MVWWPLQPLQPFQKTQLQPPVGPSVDSLCYPWFTKPTSPIGFLCLKLPPPPFAVLLVSIELHLNNTTISLSNHTSKPDKTQPPKQILPSSNPKINTLTSLYHFPQKPPHTHDEICTLKKSLRATSQHDKHLDRTSTTNWKSVCNRVQAQCRSRRKLTLYHWIIATIYGLTKAWHLQGWWQGHYLLQASAVPQAVESLTGGKFVMSLVLWFLVQSVARC